MNNTIRITVIVTGILFAGTALLVAGIFIGRTSFGFAMPWASQNPLMGRSYTGMMGEFTADGTDGIYPGYGMMGGHGPGMMGYYNPMMGTMSNSDLAADLKPLEPETVEKTLQEYLVSLNNDDLEVDDIMIFDNHACAQIVEKSTGIGAMEVLIDPVSLAVYPERGPNMMWNLKYGMMGGFSGMGSMIGQGMMGGMEGNKPETVATVTFTVTEELVGEWELGCFTDNGTHYDQGMKGSLIVNP